MDGPPGHAERPPSPPQSNDGEAGVGDGTKAVSPQDDPFTPPQTIRPAPRSAPMSVEISELDADFHNLPVQEDPYGDPSFYQTAAPIPHYYPVEQPTFVRTTQLRASTSSQANHSDAVQTRSGRRLGSPLTPEPSSYPTRPSRPPRVKKATKNAKGGKNGGPLVEEPLSLLTKDYTIPVKDMGAWVHRPVSDRMLEVEKKKGYIARPMNSFMLYRSAYAERVKQFCKENNHQVVSKVTGASWPLEPPEVRGMYEKYAIIERDNHHAAHPGYKFAPNKAGKKRGRGEDDDDEVDDDPEWEGSTRGGKRSRIGTNRSRTNTPFDFDQHQHQHQQPLTYSHPPPHPSSYQATNPYGQPPQMVVPQGYYQARVIPYGQQIDDVTVRRLENPFPQYEQPSSLVAMPNGNHNGLQRQQQGYAAGQVQYNVIDPGLQSDPNAQYYVQYHAAPPPDDGGYPLQQQQQQLYEASNTYEYGGNAYQDAGVEYGYPAAIFHPGQATLTDPAQSLWADDDQVNDFDYELQKLE